MQPLVVFASVPWGAVRLRTQHLMTRLAREAPVVVVEPPVEAGSTTLHDHRPCEGVEVLTPTLPGAAGWQPVPPPALAEQLDEHLRQRRLGRWVAWLATPMAWPLAHMLWPDRVVLDCTEGGPPPGADAATWRACEAHLLHRADLVLTAGPSLYALCRSARVHDVHCVPSAVDARHFDPSRLAGGTMGAARAAQLQDAITSPGRTRLGFFGLIDHRIDLALVDAVAVAHPSCDVVMVGPVDTALQPRLPRRPNLHWLGLQPYELLPHLMASWDACLMPYEVDASTRWLSPTKTLEYLAGEKVVISTALPDVMALYGECVHIAATRDAFVIACGSLADEPPAARARRQVAMLTTVWRSSWDDVARAVAVLLERLDRGPGSGSPFDRGPLPGRGGTTAGRTARPPVRPVFPPTRGALHACHHHPS